MYLYSALQAPTLLIRTQEVNIRLFVSTQEKQTLNYTGIRLLGNKTPYTDKIRLVEIKNKPIFYLGFHATVI